MQDDCPSVHHVTLPFGRWCGMLLCETHVLILIIIIAEGAIGEVPEWKIRSFCGSAAGNGVVDERCPQLSYEVIDIVTVAELASTLDHDGGDLSGLEYCNFWRNRFCHFFFV